MYLQHLSVLSMNGHEPDGLQREENLRQSKRHFTGCDVTRIWESGNSLEIVLLSHFFETWRN